MDKQSKNNIIIWVYCNDNPGPAYEFSSIADCSKAFKLHRDMIVRLISTGKYYQDGEDFYYFDWGLRSDPKVCQQIENSWAQRYNKHKEAMRLSRRKKNVAQFRR